MSKSVGRRASRLERWSIWISSHATSGKSAASSIAVRRKIPSEYRITLALWPTVTFCRRFVRAYSKANRTIRCVPVDADRLQRDPGVLADLEPAELAELLAQRPGVLAAPLELDALVEVLGVLADHHQVDVAVAGRAPPGGTCAGRTAANRSRLLAERHVDAAEPGPDRRRDGALDRDPAPADRLERRLGEQVAVGLERRGAGGVLLPRDAHVGGVEDQPGRRGHLGPDAVAGDERDPMVHGRDRVAAPRRATGAGVSSSPPSHVEGTWSARAVSPSWSLAVASLVLVVPANAGIGQSIERRRVRLRPGRGHDRAAHADLLPRVRERRRHHALGGLGRRDVRHEGDRARRVEPDRRCRGRGPTRTTAPSTRPGCRACSALRPMASDDPRGRRGPDHPPDRAGPDQDARTSTTSSDAATAASGRWSATAPAIARRRSPSRAPASSRSAPGRGRVHRGPHRVVAAAEGDGTRGLEAFEQDLALHLLDRLRHLDTARARVGAVEGRPAAEDAGLLREGS